VIRTYCKSLPLIGSPYFPGYGSEAFADVGTSGALAPTFQFIRSEGGRAPRPAASNRFDEGRFIKTVSAAIYINLSGTNGATLRQVAEGVKETDL
jgi:hypothetical protein